MNTVEPTALYNWHSRGFTVGPSLLHNCMCSKGTWDFWWNTRWSSTSFHNHVGQLCILEFCLLKVNSLTNELEKNNTSLDTLYYGWESIIWPQSLDWKSLGQIIEWNTSSLEAVLRWRNMLIHIVYMHTNILAFAFTLKKAIFWLRHFNG